LDLVVQFLISFRGDFSWGYATSFLQKYNNFPIFENIQPFYSVYMLFCGFYAKEIAVLISWNCGFGILGEMV